MWRPWFAWYPVDTYEGVRWLCVIDRAWVDPVGHHLVGVKGYWQYRDRS